MSTERAYAPERNEASLPSPPSERRAWIIAGALGALGMGVLLVVVFGELWRSPVPASSVAPPPLPVVESTPSSLAADAVARRARSRSLAKRSQAAIVARPSHAQQRLDAARFELATQVHVPARWMEGFYPIYAVAQRTFGINWLLLASIHRQESAFSTAAGTYHGLNFAHCCGGPMQFNVRNGPVTTWQLVSDSFIYGRRPRAYDHMTATHPSIYDDFDSIMAAGRLLAADGARYRLDFSAWYAAYDYYGHDATGVTYADEVLARAIGWSQHGFCINCGVERSLVAAVHGAYGAPVLATLEGAAARPPAQGAGAHLRKRSAAARTRSAPRKPARR
jgi:hypothetical protein